MLEESTEKNTRCTYCLHGACAHSEVIIDEGVGS